MTRVDKAIQAGGINTISESSRNTPVVYESDICVIGGSCTGVFAAVRAARMGLDVALVEKNAFLGGMATAAMVNEWHSLYDIHNENQIIGGLTVETIDRLRHRNAVTENQGLRETRYRFNSAELALELDEFVRANKIRTFLDSRCVGAVVNDQWVSHALIEDKSGRRAIQSKAFIDASGDGDLLRRSGFSAWKNERLQPASLQQLVAGLGNLGDCIWEQVKPLAEEFSYPLENSTPWFSCYPNPADVVNVFGARMNAVDASDADQLTNALFTGRRLHRALLDMIRKKISKDVSSIALAQALGVRETWHAISLHRLLGSEIMNGKSFSDAIACGTYPIDVHSPEGTTLRYLDGSETFIGVDSLALHTPPKQSSKPYPPFYQIPLRSLIPAGSKNLLVAGRLLDADKEAFGAVRVMVNMNQTGEAAGVAAGLAAQTKATLAKVSPCTVRNLLQQGGAIIPQFPKQKHHSTEEWKGDYTGESFKDI